MQTNEFSDLPDQARMGHPDALTQAYQRGYWDAYCAVPNNRETTPSNRDLYERGVVAGRDALNSDTRADAMEDA